MHFKWSRAVLGSCMIIENSDIFLPVRLFPPVRLLVFRKCSTLYVYSILYDYLVLISICFIFQNDKMLTLPSFQSAFARTRLDDDPFNTVAGSTTTTASTIGRSIINHGLKPSAEIFSTVTVTGNKSIPATHQLKSR